jgi:hypothetical protein
MGSYEDALKYQSIEVNDVMIILNDPSYLFEKAPTLRKSFSYKHFIY